MKIVLSLICLVALTYAIGVFIGGIYSLGVRSGLNITREVIRKSLLNSSLPSAEKQEAMKKFDLLLASSI